MPALCLDVSESLRRDVFLKERGDAGIEVGAEGAERGGVAVGSRRRFLSLFLFLLLDWVMMKIR